MPLRASQVPLLSLGLDEAESYHAFDFWSEKYLGVVSGKLAAKELSVGECQIVALRKVQRQPQFIASTRHVSMDAVSVLSCEWSDEMLTLKLKGVPGYTERYYFCGNGRSLQNARGEGADITFDTGGELVCLGVTFREEQASLILNF